MYKFRPFSLRKSFIRLNFLCEFFILHQKELLPSNATHESVRQQFQQFGNVAYVSLPRYRTSGRIKEFAFIEFEDKSSVVKCIEAFRQFNAVIGDTQNPENLKSVVAYVKEQEELEKQETGEVNTQEDTNSEEKKEYKEGDLEVKGAQSDESGTKVDKKDTSASTSGEPHEKESKKRTIEEPSVSEELPTKRPKIEVAENVQEKEEESNQDQEQEQKLDQEQKQEQDQEQEQVQEPDQEQEQEQKSEQKPEQNRDQDDDQEQENDDDKDDQGNTTDEKGSITDENQEKRRKKKK